MKLVNYDPDKHDVDGFIFGGWIPSHVGVSRKRVFAVLLHPPANYPCGGVSFDKHDRFTPSKNPKKRKTNYALRVRRGEETTIIAWPDSIAEAQRKLDAEVQRS